MEELIKKLKEIAEHTCDPYFSQDLDKTIRKITDKQRGHWGNSN